MCSQLNDITSLPYTSFAWVGSIQITVLPSVSRPQWDWISYSSISTMQYSFHDFTHTVYSLGFLIAMLSVSVSSVASPLLEMSERINSQTDIFHFDATPHWREQEGRQTLSTVSQCVHTAVTYITSPAHSFSMMHHGWLQKPPDLHSRKIALSHMCASHRRPKWRTIEPKVYMRRWGDNMCCIQDSVHCAC
jgi:hypothetical protein